MRKRIPEDQVPLYSLETYRMLTSCYPVKVDPDDYFSLLRILGEWASEEGVGNIMMECGFAEHPAYVHHDLINAMNSSSKAPAEDGQRVMDKLKLHGYDKFIEEARRW